ncbi:MAG TPA: AsmA family protein, partial [Xanthobacteraceae bacterium]|nr:AsmA family protein [Xanthobacteraceae bacterium]
MVATSGFKRLGFAIVALVAAGCVAVGLASFLIPADAARDAVKAEIRAVTGFDPVVRGPVTVSLFPSGTVSFANVVLGDDQDREPAFAAEGLIAHLRFFPLFVGRVEVSDVTLVRPTIAIVYNAEGQSNWSALIDTLTRTLKPDAKNTGGVVSFSEMKIADGTIVIRDAAHKLSEKLTGVEFALAWPSISKSFGATGRFVWHDQPVDASLTLSDFLSALSGDRSGLKFRLSGSPLKAAFDGFMSRRPTLKIEGTLAADAPSLRDALRWAGEKPWPGGGFGHFALKAQTSVVGGTIGLSGVNVELDGNTAEGVLTYAIDGRRTLQGTLAVEGLDLTPYISTVRLLAVNARDWDRMPIVLDGLMDFDVDLRLSAAHVTLGNARLGRTAVAANLRSGRLVVTVGESQAFSGIIKGSFGLAKSDPGADVKAQMTFTDVDLESCLGELFNLRRVEGKGDLALNMEGSGANVFAVTRTLNGTASLVGRRGALVGLDVEQLLRRLERRPLSGGGEFRSGQTPYDKLTVAMKISNGTMTVDNVKIDG